MSAVMIKCPATGEPVNTGVTSHPEQFKGESFEGYAVSCPHCKKVHAWDKSNAYLQGNPVRYTQSSGPCKSVSSV